MWVALPPSGVQECLHSCGGRDNFKTVIERSHPLPLPCLSFPPLTHVCAVCGAGGMERGGSVLTLTCSGLAVQHCKLHGGGPRFPEAGCKNSSVGGGGEGHEKVLGTSTPSAAASPLISSSLVCVVCGGMRSDVVVCNPHLLWPCTAALRVAWRRSALSRVWVQEQLR